MKRIAAMVLACGLLLPVSVLADDGVTAGVFTANNVWMMLAAGLVFIMHLGFATLESGLTRAKNTTNILFKNTFIISMGVLTYALCGFNLMYPGDFNGFLGFGGLGLTAPPDGNTTAYADGWAAVNLLVREGVSLSGRETNCAYLNGFDGMVRAARHGAPARRPENGSRARRPCDRRARWAVALPPRSRAPPGC